MGLEQIAAELRRAYAALHGIGPTEWAGVDGHVARALVDIRLALLALGEDDPAWEPAAKSKQEG